MLVILAVNILFLFSYIFIYYQSEFHSDSAAKVLLAREIYDTGQFYPKNWNYVNGDLFVVFGHLFIVPLLAFMPAGYSAHAISGAIFAGVIIYGVWLITELATIPVWRRIAVVAVAASGVSGFMAENLYGQVSYGVVIFFGCYLIYFSSKYLSSEESKKKKWGFLFFCFIFLAYWANPKRAIVTYSAPLIAALIWLIFLADIKNRRRFFEIIGISLIGALGGSILHSITIADVNNIQGAANARWLPFDLIFRNITLALKGVYAQLGGLPVENASLFSKTGLYSGLRFTIASLAIVLAPIAIRRAMRTDNRGLNLIALFAAFSILITLFLQISTTVPDMSDPIQSSRYLVPGVMLCLILILISPLKWSRPPVWIISVAAVLITIISGAYSNYLMSADYSAKVLSQSGQVNPDRQKILALLAEKNLEYGYATYWNAGVLSVLSDEKTRIRQVQLHNGIPVPMRHLSSNRWYRPASWRGKTFLLLQENEVAHLNWGKLAQFGLTPDTQYKTSGFVVIVFKENIASFIPGWDTRYEESTKFLPFEGVLSQVGRLVKSDTGSGYILVAEKGESGALHYGPYVDVEPGRYRVTFDVQAEQSTSAVVRIDVAAAPDQKIYSELVLTESKEPQKIEFNLEKPRTLEFRVWALGIEKVRFNGLTIERIDDLD